MNTIRTPHLRPVRRYCRASGTDTPPRRSKVLPRGRILLGDATQRLRQLPSDAVDSCVTSPPYYLLRDYQVAGQIGLEARVEDWVEQMRAVMEEVGRVLKPAGSLWLNLGDSYSRGERFGALPKSLLLGPERLLVALSADGWIVRNKIIWAKPNPLPTSVGDRLTTSYEVIYFLVRSRHYYFDLDAIREPHRSTVKRRAQTAAGKPAAWAGPLAGSQDGLRRARPDGLPGHARGKNPGDVWSIPTRGFRGPHFATFPPELVRRPILATCPEAICTACGTAWKRSVQIDRIPIGGTTGRRLTRDDYVMRTGDQWRSVRTIGELEPCGCQAPTVPGLVLDPFMGSGTVGLVAQQLGRDWLGIELNPTFKALALDRIRGAT